MKQLDSVIFSSVMMLLKKVFIGLGTASVLLLAACNGQITPDPGSNPDSSTSNPPQNSDAQITSSQGSTGNTDSASATVCHPAPHSIFSISPLNRTDFPSEHVSYMWNSEGFTYPEEATAWANCGFTADLAFYAKEEGLTPESVAPFTNSGVPVESTADIDALVQQVKAAATQKAAEEAPAKQHQLEVADMYAAGVKTDEQAQAWIDLLQKYSLTPSQEDQPTDLDENTTSSVQALIAADIAPDQADKYLASGLSFQDSNIVAKTLPLLKAGYSIPQTKVIISFGVPKTQVSDFETVLQNDCSNNIGNDNDLVSANPYAISGHCFIMQTINIAQWLGQNSALVNSDSARLDFDIPPQGKEIPSAIVIGEAPYVYDSVSA